MQAECEGLGGLQDWWEVPRPRACSESCPVAACCKQTMCWGSMLAAAQWCCVTGVFASLGPHCGFCTCCGCVCVPGVCVCVCWCAAGVHGVDRRAVEEGWCAHACMQTAGAPGAHVATWLGWLQEALWVCRVCRVVAGLVWVQSPCHVRTCVYSLVAAAFRTPCGCLVPYDLASNQPVCVRPECVAALWAAA